MGCTKTRIEVVSINFRERNCLVIGLSNSVPFNTDVKERVLL
jgi:hypothetical protein